MLYPSLVDKVLKKGYYKRYSNKFSRLDPSIEDYKINEIWNNRDVDLLKNSYTSNIVGLMRDHMLMSNTKNSDDPNIQPLDITVNLSPYKLSSKDKEEFKLVLSNLLNVNTIKLIDMNNSELNHAYLSGNYNQVILHDFEEWTLPNLQTFEYYGKLYEESKVSSPLKRVTFTVPFILREGMENTDINNIDEVISHQQLGFSNTLGLEVLLLEEFSIKKGLNNEM